MRKKNLWALMLVGLSTVSIGSIVNAETRPGLLDSWKLPSLFGSSESKGTESSGSASSESRSRSFGNMQRPGNASARGTTSPKSGSSSSLPNLNLLPGLGKVFNKVIGTEEPVGVPDEGIVAPPPPDLSPVDEPTPVEPLSKQPVVSPTKVPALTSQSEIPALETPLDVDEKLHPSPALPVARTKSMVPPTSAEALPAISPQTIRQPLAAAAPLEMEPSSRRAWQSDATSLSYNEEAPGPSEQTQAEMTMVQPIDRTPDSPYLEDESASAGTVDAAAVIPQRAKLLPLGTTAQVLPSGSDEAFPEPVLFGQEHLEPVESRNRFSTAARLAPASSGNSLRGEAKSEYTPRPAVLDYKTSNVEPASYDNLPPIITPEEARKLRAQRSK